MNARYIIGVFGHGRKNNFRIHEITIKPVGIDTTISGRTRYPLVSSSKNLKRPALDAGRGADFLLLMVVFEGKIFT
jgi:hypothetical protein